MERTFSCRKLNFGVWILPIGFLKSPHGFFEMLRFKKIMGLIVLVRKSKLSFLSDLNVNKSKISKYNFCKLK